MKIAGKNFARGHVPHPHPNAANWYRRLAQQMQLFNPEAYPGKITPLINPDSVSDKAQISDNLLHDLENIGQMPGWNMETLLKAHGAEFDFIDLKGEKYVRFEYAGSVYLMDPVSCDPEEAHEWINSVDDPFYYIDMGDFAKEYWDGVGPDTILYHGTGGENIESIRQEGLAPMCKTRGMGNRGTGCAVFATEESSLAETYTYPHGVVIEILVGAMKAANLLLPVSREEPIDEYEAYMALAHKIGIDDYNRDLESGIDHQTVIFYGHIPPQFLRIPQKQAMNWFRRTKIASKFYGYKIVAFDGQRYYSAYSKETVDTTIGKVTNYGGQGLFLGTTPQFCMDYYSGMTDHHDALLTYEIDNADLIKGDPSLPNGEIQVRRAILVKVENL